MNKEYGQPWWKFGHVWMVFAGPAIVVVASFITLYLAIKIPDPVVSSYGQDNRPEAIKLDKHSTNMAPAMQARNHAATGVPAPAEP
ncbi:hypothetical protein BH10PSE16_BH10PSE16_17220 [soil metagenome]